MRWRVVGLGGLSGGTGAEVEGSGMGRGRGQGGRGRVLRERVERGRVERGGGPGEWVDRTSRQAGVGNVAMGKERDRRWER